MARRVDQVELVARPVVRLIAHPHRVELDGDPTLAFKIERVEHLGLHFALLQGAGFLDESVSERRLAVIDMSDDAEVADVTEIQRTPGLGK